jgi:predicted GNAT family acetyltransferase
MDVDLSNVEVTNNAGENRFEAPVEGQMAVLDYHWRGDELVLTHTEVPPAARGEGVGGKVVKAALEEARSRGLQVVPRCPFVRRYVEEHPEYEALVAG